ncbi:hypothetical protein NIE88_06835 [Sporolactobacillus shoreicorticis]|uniref:Uncharacterized protein n=1 Tax=Sporolactobacillus shoreicorticis TaxID=1923877 RepID=A0ABW5S8F1_9BACL|nr:hypothetical protein [Sporolactobacillus shoreicorticis]MCO7125484.1 hypothetical protein [Sporolactobacillus shoreicorticis]
MYHAIFHIDEEEKWPLLLGNVKNLMADNMAVKIEVLANAATVLVISLESLSIK